MADLTLAIDIQPGVSVECAHRTEGGVVLGSTYTIRATDLGRTALLAAIANALYGATMGEMTTLVEMLEGGARG